MKLDEGVSPQKDDQKVKFDMKIEDEKAEKDFFNLIFLS